MGRAAACRVGAVRRTTGRKHTTKNIPPYPADGRIYFFLSVAFDSIYLILFPVALFLAARLNSARPLSDFGGRFRGADRLQIGGGKFLHRVAISSRNSSPRFGRVGGGVAKSLGPRTPTDSPQNGRQCILARRGIVATPRAPHLPLWPTPGSAYLRDGAPPVAVVLLSGRLNSPYKGAFHPNAVWPLSYLSVRRIFGSQLNSIAYRLGGPRQFALEVVLQAPISAKDTATSSLLARGRPGIFFDRALPVSSDRTVLGQLR